MAGVCAGLAEYFEVDPVICRLVAILVLVLTGFLPGVIAYLLAMAIMPKKPE